METPRGFLKLGEPHPAVFTALKYVSLHMNDPMIKEALASCAIENNRLAEICLETIRRLENKEAVSDRYLLGLAWSLREFKEA